MSKKLIFMRHAKSDWSVPGLKDFDRTLNSRGMTDAPKMGNHLAKTGLKPEIILASPSVRTTATAQFVAEQLKFDLDKITYDEEIYEAPVRTLLKIINNIDNKYNTILMVGHNPSMSYLAEYLTKYDIGNISTSGIVCMEFEVDNWAMISEGLGKFSWYIYPKMFE